MSQLLEIQSQIAALQAQAKSIMENERVTAILDIRKKMEEFQIKPSELVAASPKTPRGHLKQASSKPAPVKFRGPNGETWSGRGLAPRWLVAEEASGKARTDFLV